MVDISGIKRGQAAEEGTRRFFQTTNLIVSHFKRDSDKQNIYKLSTESNSLSKLLVAASAIHTYHYVGIRTKTSEEMVSNVENTEAFENAEKKELYNEMAILIGQSIQHELELSQIILNYEERFLNALISGTNISDENFIGSIKDELEEHLVSALNKYPLVFFYDHIGELTGYNNQIKSNILADASELKAVSLDLEKALIEEDLHGDKYIEITALNQLVEKLKKDFEFQSVKDLKLETFSIRKMLSKILSYRMNIYPISMRGIESYRRATDIKREIYEEFSKSNQTEIEYNNFENGIIDKIIVQIKAQSRLGPTNLIYFLENMLDVGFGQVYDMLSRFGVNDVLMFCQIIDYDLDAFQRDMKMHQLTKMIFIKLTSKENEFQKVESKLNEMKKQNLCITERSVHEILDAKKAHEIEYVKEACQKANVNFEELMQLHEKNKIINFIFQKKYPVKWLYGYIMMCEQHEILLNIGKFIYYSFFSKICRQIARILETYLKLKDDKSLILLGFKRISESNEHEAWVRVKIEELIIERLRTRQEELAIIFNAENHAYTVNSFILARFLDTTQKLAEEILKNEPSFIYEGAIELGLPQEMVSPVSYVLAYDILRRLQEQQELKQIEKDQAIEIKNEKAEQQKANLKKVQELNTLNFIEKKITSSMMSVNTNINPTGLYWTEKDQKLTMDNIKLHSELTERKICEECGLDITDNPCNNHPNKIKPAVPMTLFIQYYSFALNRMKEMYPKLKVPDYQDLYAEVKDWMNAAMATRLRRPIGEEESKLIIEGERLEVAKNIASSIGAYLDKALYKKFKETLKN